MVWRYFQVQLFLQGCHHPGHMFGRILDLDLFELFESIEPTIPFRQFQQTEFVAALGNIESDPFEQLFVG